MPAVMGALIAGGVTPQGDEDEVGEGSIVCERLCVLAGMAVAKETFGRLGVRCRALVSDDAQVAGGHAVAGWAARSRRSVARRRPRSASCHA